MPKQSSVFSDLIEKGEFRVDDTGHALLNGQLLLMVPPPVILKLQRDLADELGYDEMTAFVKDLGVYQVEQAIDRYEERYGMDELSKKRILSYVEDILKILGWGEIHVEKADREDGIRITVKHPTLPILYRDRHEDLSDTPVCHYLCGLLEAACDAIFEQDVTVNETACAATGGKKCVFEAEL